MSIETRQSSEQPKGFWYELLPSGRTLICFKIHSHGKKITKKLLLPVGVKELQPLEK